MAAGSIRQDYYTPTDAAQRTCILLPSGKLRNTGPDARHGLVAVARH